MPNAEKMTKGKIAPAAATAAIALLHALGVALLFRPLSALWSAEPLVEQDWGLHFHHLESMREFWARDSRFWGYNPLFMAGYPSNTIQDASVKLFEFAALLLGGLGRWRVFKLMAFASVAAWPLAGNFAARCFSGGDARARWAAPIAAALAAAVWWNGLAREMLFYGMIGFPLACALALVATAALHRVAEDRRAFALPHAAWLAACAALPAAQIQGAAILFIPWSVIALAAARRRDRRAIGWALAGPLVGVALNLFWLRTFLQWRDFDASSEIALATPYFASADPLAFAKDYLTGAGYWTFRTGIWEKGLRLALLGLGGAGIVSLWRQGRRQAAAALGLAAAAMFLFAYFGSLWLPLRAQQPMRFKIALDLILAIPSAWALGDAAARLRERNSILALGAVGLAAICFAINLERTESAGGMTLSDRLPSKDEQIIAWLRERTSPDERILFEESGDESGFVYGGAYLSSFAAHRAGRQLIGGPANAYNDCHHVAELHSGRLFKKLRLNEMPESEIRRLFEDYNIGACVVFDRASVEGLLACNGLVELDRRIGDIWLMKSTQPRSWVREGSAAEVRATLGAIDVRGASGESLVLKYHWVRGMECDPPASVEPTPSSPMDPIPFVRIVNPAPDFRIRLR